ncbi:MAG: hypothetical protein HQK74_01390 [Desulfamplus sp.]|nr:hypothetical protein [Desulfamplus sp.]
MKQYVIDGLSPYDYERLKKYFDEILGQPSLGSIYWLEIDPELLSPMQISHTDCQPHYFAFELDERGHLSCEFLVRIKKSIKCDCMGYADKKQRDWLMDKIDDILKILDITI